MLESFRGTDTAMLACLETITVTLFSFCENTEPELCLTKSQPITFKYVNFLFEMLLYVVSVSQFSIMFQRTQAGF